MKKSNFIIFNIVAILVILFTIFWLDKTIIITDYYTPNVFGGEIIGQNFEWGWLHYAVFISSIAIFIAWIICFIFYLSDNEGPIAFFADKFNVKKDKEFEDKVNIKKTFNFKKIAFILLGIIIGYNIFSFTYSSVTQSIKVFNQSKIYQNAYNQKVEEKQGFYDKLWKTYLTKSKITNVNQEMFLKVSKIIMENRKDGEKLTWKWVNENQNIPYEEFTVFYKDLSNFITSQREGYFNIEKECQQIANQNNTLLDTFPNNMYNKVLHCPKIKFEYGILSDSTINVFKNKKENLKE